MTLAAVDTLLGPPRLHKQHAPDDVRESRRQGARGYDVILGYDPEQLTDATFPSQPSDLTIFGLKIFLIDPDQLIARLKLDNGGFYAIFHDIMLAFERLDIVLID